MSEFPLSSCLEQLTDYFTGLNAPCNVPLPINMYTVAKMLVNFLSKYNNII